jgi:hypothetical protein
MRMVLAALLGITVGLGAAGMAGAQSQPAPAAGVELKSGGEATPKFELSAPPAIREGTRPRDAGFYPEDVRVRHEPAFVEPLTHRPAAGPVKKMGASLWTAPAARGSLASSPPDVPGWLGFGFTLIWE